mmetsp:Transcript_14938/g.24429  ORF Transcript_14938/g.24429 Transcript_14938/m.24429 type:complete len:80 (+) Transcript_14938:189-428(+)
MSLQIIIMSLQIGRTDGRALLTVTTAAHPFCAATKRITNTVNHTIGELLHPVGWDERFAASAVEEACIGLGVGWVRRSG